MQSVPNSFGSNVKDCLERIKLWNQQTDLNLAFQGHLVLWLFCTEEIWLI